MRYKLRAVTGQAIYTLRKAIVEPVFGQIKAGRGFRRFAFRGIGKVRAEWRLICLTHNLLKLFQARWTPPAGVTGTARGASRPRQFALHDRWCAPTVGRDPTPSAVT